MRWSKLKQRLEERFAAEIGKRVAVHVTRYHRAHEQEGELFVTVDGTKVYGASDLAMFKRLYGNVFDSDRYPGRRAVPLPYDELVAAGHPGHQDLVRALASSLSQSIDAMLASPHPLVRALGVLDARCGSRRLQRMDFEQEHALVVGCAALREAPAAAALVSAAAEGGQRMEHAR